MSKINKEIWKRDGYREKMSLALKGANSGIIRGDLKNYNIKEKSVQVYQYDLNGLFINEWESAREAGRKLKLNHSGIYKSCNMEIKVSQKFIWRFKRDIKDKLLKLDIGNIFHPSRKAIIQYDLNNNFISEWDSISNASKNTNISGGHIGNCCNKKRNKSGNFFWEFKNENTDYKNILIEKIVKEKNKILTNYDKSKEPIYQYDVNGNFIREWESAKDIKNGLKINHTYVYQVCNGKLKKTCGFVWRFKKDIIDKKEKIKIDQIRNNKSKDIFQYGLNGVFIKQWYSAADVSKELQINVKGILNSCKDKKSYNQSGGFIWKYEKFEKIEPHLNYKLVTLSKYDLNNNLIDVYKSFADAAKNINGFPSNIGLSIKQNKPYKSFIWKKITSEEYIEFKKQLELK